MSWFVFVKIINLLNYVIKNVDKNNLYLKKSLKNLNQYFGSVKELDFCEASA